MMFRQWRVGAVLAVAMLSSTALAARDVDADHRAMAAAKGQDAATLRDAILADAPVGAVDRDEYGKKYRDVFSDLLTSSNKDAQLNSAALFAQLKTLSLDSRLMGMLDSTKYPAVVRYWGAKGLSDLMPILKKLPGGGGTVPAVKALRTAAASEKSVPVQREIVRALAQADDAAALIDALNALGASTQSAMPDRFTLDLAAGGLQQLDMLLKSAPASVKEAAAKTAATWASLAGQWQVEQKSQDPATALPDGYGRTIDAAFKVLNTATGKSFSMGAKSLADINAITGSDGKGGEMQKVLPSVPVPAPIVTGR